jgi:hypothetical protein
MQQSARLYGSSLLAHRQPDYSPHDRLLIRSFYPEERFFV